MASRRISGTTLPSAEPINCGSFKVRGATLPPLLPTTCAGFPRAEKRTRRELEGPSPWRLWPGEDKIEAVI